MSSIRLTSYLLSLIVLLSGQAYSFVGHCNDSLSHAPSTMFSGEVLSTEMDHNSKAHQPMSLHEMHDHDMGTMHGLAADHDMKSMSHDAGPCCDQECDDCEMSHGNSQVTDFSDFSFLNASSHNQFLLSLELTSSPSSPFKPPIVS